LPYLIVFGDAQARPGTAVRTGGELR
jgi:hypothetical protein